MRVYHFYKYPGFSESVDLVKLSELQKVTALVKKFESEFCYNVGVKDILSSDEKEKIIWLLDSPFSDDKLNELTKLENGNNIFIFEIGPRLNFSTPFSSNALSICKAVGLDNICRIELSIRYKVTWAIQDQEITREMKEQIVLLLHDQMTQCQYHKPIESFDHGIQPENWFLVNVLSEGKKALQDVNIKLGLAFDDWDLDYYTHMFKDKIKRNPTSVECFDLAQSNSEHSRHWFFKGKMVLNGEEKADSLMDMIMRTQRHTNQNNVIKFSDNSSAILGFTVEKLQPIQVHLPSKFELKTKHFDIAFTAETHNFPTGVSPFSGAATGSGGRIRDVQAVGRGGLTIAGTAGYCVGNLLISEYEQPWEEKTFSYPSNFANPLSILIEASNGASDYGNKFGEPVICGFTRSFGMLDHFGERREWIKPIMFSGGVGALDHSMIDKKEPKKGMRVVKVGGPAYRIGVGGGAASSIQVQGDNKCELDFGAVQRGDPEMENKLNRLIRACIEDPVENPICSIHDQGAGGNGNVLKEIVEHAGAVIFTNNFSRGDNSLSTMELWGAEYQESNAILIEAESMNKLFMLAKRERCPVDFVGLVTGDGKVILSEDKDVSENSVLEGSYGKMKNMFPFNLDLGLILGKMPQKVFTLNELSAPLKPLQLPSNLLIMEALNRVLRLVTVCSKRFLTNKVDRCVTGLIAQQQCVGPLHTPLADCAVTALSMFNVEGIATAIGEQPIKVLVNVKSGARMTVMESLMNLMFARISNLKDVKCSGNWMWAAKVPGEGAALYKACESMCNIMSEIGIGVDGGKDSLSMAARVKEDIVKAPGSLVISAYAPCPDIRYTVTPDIKSPCKNDVGALLWVQLSENHRLGGSSLAQCFSQLGYECPDIEDVKPFKEVFNLTQQLILDKQILAGHDVSDGGFITCVLEMAFSGLSGLELCLDIDSDPIAFLFAEELGWILEVTIDNKQHIMELHEKCGVSCTFIGYSKGYGMDSLISVRDKRGNILLENNLISLFQMWEETSYKLECRQANQDIVNCEFSSWATRKGPTYKLTFNPEIDLSSHYFNQIAVRIAVLREEGTNGDREMISSLHMVGFEVWDVTMQDLLNETVTLDRFRGLIFPGGFSYGDVLGSAKGWAACLLFNTKLKAQFNTYYERPDTFGFGVCNGCQLMSLMGWVGNESNKTTSIPDVILDKNYSGRFECRFTSVRIENSPSIMFDGMEGSILGVWIAHGEGRFTFRNEIIKKNLYEKKLIALSYTDDDGNRTEKYPMNPNGSPGGIAGICSDNGRFLAMMPHPERCTKIWQWPYLSPNLSDLKVSPWLKMFHNALLWAHNVET